MSRDFSRKLLADFLFQELLHKILDAENYFVSAPKISALKS
jgi:hypothetical protein